MNEIKQKRVPIELDKTRYVNFDLNALCELEEKYETLDKALGSISTNPSMKDIRYILYLALNSDDEELTEKKVGSLIGLQNIGEIIDTLGKAMDTALPVVSEDEKN